MSERTGTAAPHRSRLQPWWVAAAVLAVGWAGLLVIGLTRLFFIVVLDDVYCEHPTEASNPGELGWSIVPPGPTCSWGSGAGEEVRGPTPVMSIWLALLLIVAGLTVWAVRHGRKDRPR